MRTEPAFRREAVVTSGLKIWKKDRSVFGRNWQARRIDGAPPPPTRTSTKASRFDGAGSELQSPITRIRQVEHRARPPQTLACGTLLRRLASSPLGPFGPRTVLPLPYDRLIMPPRRSFNVRTPRAIKANPIRPTYPSRK